MSTAFLRDFQQTQPLYPQQRGRLQLETASTLGRSVAAMVAICTLLTIVCLASILVASRHANIAKRVHEYLRQDGELNRVVDPWRPLPGCIFLQSAQARYCGRWMEKTITTPR